MCDEEAPDDVVIADQDDPLQVALTDKTKSVKNTVSLLRKKFLSGLMQMDQGLLTKQLSIFLELQQAQLEDGLVTETRLRVFIFQRR